MTYSLGFAVGAESRLSDVLWGGPAYKSGLTIGTQLIAVNGIAFDPDGLKRVVKEAKSNGAAIELLVKNGNRFRTVKIDYHDGLRYPRLERTGTGAASLDAILAPLN